MGKHVGKNNMQPDCSPKPEEERRPWGASLRCGGGISPLLPLPRVRLGGIAAICGPARLFHIFSYLNRGGPHKQISGTGKAAPRTARSRLQPEAQAFRCFHSVHATNSTKVSNFLLSFRCTSLLASVHHSSQLLFS
jgi:hypothetical protein